MGTRLRQALLRRGWLCALVPLAGAAAPADHLVLDCYLRQSGSLGLGQFVRHLTVVPEQGLVLIADGLGGGTPQFVGNGHLVALDASRLVYDYRGAGSSGRTEIDRRSGAFVYRDGPREITGRCEVPAG